MPRHPRSASPEDLQDWVERTANPKRSKSTAEIYLLAVKRDIELRAGVDLKLNKISGKLAALAQRRGQSASKPCASCTIGAGPFTECIVLPGLLADKCANCCYSRSSCEHARGRLPTPRIFNLPHNPIVFDPLFPQAADNTGPLQQPVNPVSTSGSKRKSQECHIPQETVSTAATGSSHKRSRCQRVDDNSEYPVATTHHAPTTARQYRIFGDFSLPHPTILNDIPQFQRDLALTWEQSLETFSKRDFSTIRKSIVDLDQAFNEFETREVQTWKDIGQQPGKNEHLVRPSGKLDSPLAHHLNQPSMTTAQLKNGATADNSNGCTRMVMNNAYKHRETLMFDQLHRRSESSDGVKAYPPEILKCHEDFTQQIYESMTSPVVILYGQVVQERVLRHSQLEYTILPLWHWAEGISLILFHESSFGNAQPGYRIRRIGLFASHPQHLFYQPQDSPVAQMQDKTTGIAVKMVSGAVPIIEEYYSKWIWKRDNLTTLRWFPQTATESSRDQTSHTQDSPSATDTIKSILLEQSFSLSPPDSIFSVRPHSVKALRDEILPAAIQRLREDQSEWRHFSDLPTEVLSWLRGVKHSVFPEYDIMVLGDVSKASTHEGTDSSNKDIILELMLLQQDQVRVAHGQYPELFFMRLDMSEVSVKCIGCADLFPTDTSPRWAINRPDHYYVRRHRCTSKICNQKLMSGVPVDPDIPYVNANGNGKCSQLLRTNSRPPSFDLQPFLLHIDDATDVECWCIRCKERTRVSGGGDRYVDKFPRWTGSLENLLYIERSVVCLTCKKECGQSGRFVPANSSIRSIYPRRIQDFAKRHAHCDVDLQKYLLGQLLPSSNGKTKAAEKKKKKKSRNIMPGIDPTPESAMARDE